LRIAAGLPSLRRPIILAAVQEALLGGNSRLGMRLVHYSVQTNHIHLILEACDALSLTRGMQGVMVRIARAVNRAAQRSGKVFGDHYFARELQTPAEVRRAVRYVLDNAMLHAGSDPTTDECASSAPVVAPRTWLLGGSAVRPGRCRSLPGAHSTSTTRKPGLPADSTLQKLLDPTQELSVQLGCLNTVERSVAVPIDGAGPHKLGVFRRR